MLLLCAVMVDVDADVGISTTECCTVAGVELSSAPRRPINFKTLLKKMDFVPYGENRDADAQRLAYYKQVRGYIKARVEPAIEAVRASSEEFPDHLKKVCGFSFVLCRQSLVGLQSGPGPAALITAACDATLLPERLPGSRQIL